MQNGAFGYVVLRIVSVEIEIESTFIAVIPEQNRRMILVMLDELLYQLVADACVVICLPARELIENVKAELIARIQKVLIRRIMAGAYSIGVQLLDQVDVVARDLLRMSSGPNPARTSGDQPL